MASCAYCVCTHAATCMLVWLLCHACALVYLSVGTEGAFIECPGVVVNLSRQGWLDTTVFIVSLSLGLDTMLFPLCWCICKEQCSFIQAR